MLHIKFDQDWLTGLRDIQVRKCKIFVIQGQVTPQWVVWSGPKSNSSELLCLSWLSATLMMIRSKMNELAWRQHFPIISLWEFFLDAQGQLPPLSVSDLAEIRTRPRFYVCPRYMQVQKGSDKKQPRKCSDIVFPIISQCGLSVAMETRVSFQSAAKTLGSLSLFPVMLHIKLYQDWPTGFRDSQVWMCGRRRTDDGRTKDHWYTSSQVS